MAIVKWTPMRELENIRRDMERLVDEFIEPFPRRHLIRWPRLTESGTLVPNVELINRKGEFLVRAELPGIDKKDIDLSITEDTLTIKGELKKREEVNEEDYLLSEISYGRFARTITLPSEVESEKANATVNNGMLEIVLPKKKEAKPKEIKVEVS
ncbi:spore protein SP21 [bacterium BMS3Abin07]|nr:spore protein SP21 [bacterium BMS3Abin07]GBE33038.1 spore protein SP21 [bacterium BMS3Bbin05]